MKEVLTKGELKENMFFMPQIDRKIYIKVNEVLNSIGLIWNKSKKAHIADGISPDDLQDAINDIIETGECTTIKETIKKFQYYPTPKLVAEFLLDLAGEDDGGTYDILEPSAGKGSLAGNMNSIHNLTCIELDPLNIQELKLSTRHGNTEVLNMDFLNYNEKTFDKIIMNPPFSKSQDVKHILHAYTLLRNGGVLVSIASSSITTREGAIYDELRDLNPEIIELPNGSFKESGTMVNTVIIRLTK